VTTRRPLSAKSGYLPRRPDYLKSASPTAAHSEIPFQLEQLRKSSESGRLTSARPASAIRGARCTNDRLTASQYPTS
jgi:hypothetical protein